MPTFMVDGTAMLASFFHGLTEAQAIELYTAADAATGQHTADAALRYTVSRNGKSKPAAIRIVVTVNDSDGSAIVHTDEYHPRKDGKAMLDFHTDYVCIDND